MLAVWLAPLGLAQEINPSVRLDGAPLKLDAPAILDVAAGRTLVPIRHVAEPLGYTVTWDEATRTVRAERDGHAVEFRIGSREAMVDGEPVALSVAPRQVRNRALVPLRFFAELAGAEVAWDNATQSIDITSPTSAVDSPHADWAEPLAGMRRTGYNAAASFGSRAVPMWEKQLDGEGYNLPVSPVTTGEGLLFVTLNGHNFTALDRETGKVVWDSNIHYGISPVYDTASGLVYVLNGGPEAARLYAMNATDGTPRWFAAVGNTWLRATQPLLMGGKVIVNQGDSDRRTLLAFDAATGSKLWETSVKGAGIPAAYGARLFLADEYGGVHAYRATDGTPLWSHPGDSSEREYGQYNLVVDGGHVYLSIGRRMIALDEKTGDLVWKRDDLAMAGGLAADGSRLWVAVRDGLNVLDAATGEQLHYPAICNSWASAPVLSRSHAFVACDGAIYAINQQDYQVTRVAAGSGPLSLDGDRLYYSMGGSYDRTVGALMARP